MGFKTFIYYDYLVKRKIYVRTVCSLTKIFCDIYGALSGVEMYNVVDILFNILHYWEGIASGDNRRVVTLALKREFRLSINCNASLGHSIHDYDIWEISVIEMIYSICSTYDDKLFIIDGAHCHSSSLWEPIDGKEMPLVRRIAACGWCHIEHFNWFEPIFPIATGDNIDLLIQSQAPMMVPALVEIR